ncbi:major facilitator superfamily domain-containing protein [Microdochium trichocladiopsis]|uniref:Major facilitator superfamily domain-containing protein n=1 Tax=Microdochium trichocladiopsis TaxID=1682393 RepID=A0A9P8Y0J1_9PEZI|nr:major facilitator superfamily domain-containing protein [Microdochium trichocladiopsis]KAH7024621.1 major facilitator superfamily domain-containing protein [Microdochium trichocladiopsis]
MADYDPEKAPAAPAADATSNHHLHLTTSSSDSSLHAKEEADGHHDHHHDHDHHDTAEHASLGSSEEEHTNADIVPGGWLDRQLSHNNRSLDHVESRASGPSRLSNVLSNTISRVRSSRRRAGLERAPIPESNLAEGIVAWDSQDDPEMPLNWPASRKWMQVAGIAAITLLTPFTSSALAPGISNMMRDLDVQDPVVGSLTVSIYLLGYVIGPLGLAPLAEMYGKKIVLDAANVSFCLWQIGCALSPNIASLIIFRFLAGVGGSGCLTLGGGFIGDMFPPEQRGTASGLWILGPVLGPNLGPLVGGFLAESIGWRWNFWITLILGGIITVMIIVYNKETNYTTIIDRKIKRLETERQQQQDAGAGADQPPRLINHYARSRLTTRALFSKNFIRPLKMLCLSRIVTLLSIYIAFLYGTLYLLFTTLTGVLKSQYGFTTGQSGLVYLALGLGNLSGWAIITFRSDKHVIKLTRANDGVFVPEMRLSISIPFSALIPVTFFWYGWSAEYGLPWQSTVFSLVPFGLGVIGVFMPLTTYLIDCFPMYASSAIAANTVLRSLVGAFLPLAGTPMYDTLGLGWGNSLLGFLCVAMIPLPLFFHRFGGRLRKKERFEL